MIRQLLIFTLRLCYCLFMITTTITAFELLPFMQIDEQFYLRLAQCQAKCVAKIGSSTRVQLLDGHWRHSLDSVSSPLVEMCKIGCLESDSPSPSPSGSDLATDPTQSAFVQGKLFFRQTSPGNPFLPNPPLPPHPAHHPPAPLFHIRPLCVQRSAAPPGILKSTPAAAGGEKFEALLAIEPQGKQGRRRIREQEPAIRFVVQWRRRTKAEEVAKEGEEPKWITASIENSRTFRASGLRPGHLYQFSAQPVSPDRPEGAPALSQWIDFGALAMPDDLQADAGSGRTALHFLSRYNTDHGVAALVRWRREDDGGNDATTKPVVHSRLRRHTRALRHFSPPPPPPAGDAVAVQELKAIGEFAESMEQGAAGHSSTSSAVVFPSCSLQIEWANKSTKVAEVFELDGSDGFLLRHLAFGSQYTVRILPSGDLSSAPPVPFLEGTFQSMHCSQVYGSGSLECDPEPMRRLAVRAFPENASALVSWEQPDELANILLYELGIEPVVEAGVNPPQGCEVEPSARVVNAQSNSALVALPMNAICEFQLRVTVYDLLGRDASAHLRFSFIPSGASSTLSSHPSSPLRFLLHLDGSLLALLSVLIFVPLAALVTLICTFSRQGTRKKAVRQRLPGGPDRYERRTNKKKHKKDDEAERKKKLDRKGKKGDPEEPDCRKGERQQQPPQQCETPRSTGTTDSSVVAGSGGGGEHSGRQPDPEEAQQGLMRWMGTRRNNNPEHALIPGL